MISVLKGRQEYSLVIFISSITRLAPEFAVAVAVFLEWWLVVVQSGDGTIRFIVHGLQTRCLLQILRARFLGPSPLFDFRPFSFIKPGLGHSPILDQNDESPISTYISADINSNRFSTFDFASDCSCGIKTGPTSLYIVLDDFRVANSYRQQCKLLDDGMEYLKPSFLFDVLSLELLRF